MRALRHVALFVGLAIFGFGMTVPAHASDDQGTRAQNNNGRRMRFQGMDRDGDGVITRTEWRGNIQSFRQQDLNGDGVLSGNEVWVPAGQQDPLFGDRNIDQRGLTAAFRRADVNNDGVIDRDEWYGDLPTFERVDRNDDGRINRTEFLGDDAVGTSGSASFNELDRNGNGVVTANEWIGPRAEFNRLDADDDGVVTRDEYRSEQTTNPFGCLSRGRDTWPRGRQTGRLRGSQHQRRQMGSRRSARVRTGRLRIHRVCWIARRISVRLPRRIPAGLPGRVWAEIVKEIGNRKSEIGIESEIGRSP